MEISTRDVQKKSENYSKLGRYFYYGESTEHLSTRVFGGL